MLAKWRGTYNDASCAHHPLDAATRAAEGGNVMVTEKGEALLAEWKNRLGLSEWRIILVDNCKPEDMTLGGCAGYTDWEEANKTARIEILDPQCYGERVAPFDYEKTLVHELLHLKTCLVSDQVDDLQARYMHQMIDDLARAFVDAKRTEPPKEVEE